MEKTTRNIVVPNMDLDTLQSHFSDCFDKDGRFLIEKFQNRLVEQEINISKESYGMEWLGKSYARLLATDPAKTLLRPEAVHNAKIENQNSENLLLKGDNLEVLKHLSNAYYEQVNIIYIDPPYNTGNDGFMYHDDRKFTVQELQKLTGISEEKAKRILAFTQGGNNSHSAWLTFIYPRLYVARQLLQDDGVLYVSIDEHEVAQLRLLLDDVFGEENFVALAPRKTGAGSAATNSDSELRKLNDYVFIYKKNNVIFNKKKNGEKQFPYSDEHGDYLLAQFQASGSAATRADRPSLFYPIYVLGDDGLTTSKPENFKREIVPDKVNGEDGRWLWKKETFDVRWNREIHVDGNKLHRKVYRDPTADHTKYQVEKAWLEGFTNSQGTKDFNAHFEPTKGLFSHPKPVALLKHLLKLVNTQGDDNTIVLDFFGGSGTTAEAVMQLNAEDHHYRRFVLIQIPEKIDPKRNKVAYEFVTKQLRATPTIFEITRERIARAAQKTTQDNGERIKEREKEVKRLRKELGPSQQTTKIEELESEIHWLHTQDLGFRIFEATPIWEDYSFEEEEFDPAQTLFDPEKLTEDDVQALLTTWKTNDGLRLTEDLQTVSLSGYQAYYGNNKLYLMHDGFTTDSLRALLEKIDMDKQFTPRSVFCFGYRFPSKNLREISENLKLYGNKKNIDIDVVPRI